MVFNCRISFPLLRSIACALALLASPLLLRAQELPAAPSSLSFASAPTTGSAASGSNLFGTPSLFVSAPGTVRWALFLTGLPHGVAPAGSRTGSGMLYRNANPFVLRDDSITSTSSSFVVGGMNLNAGLAHGRQTGIPLSGFSVSTKASGMDFSLSGGVTSGGFGSSGYGFANDRGGNSVAPSGSPQLALRLKF